MAATSLTKAQESLDRAQASLARKAAQTKMFERTLVRKATLSTTAALYGTLNRFNVPIAVAGFPWKLGIWGLAQLGEALTKGSAQAALGGVADATMAIYIERSITTDTLVAGNGYDDSIETPPDDSGEM